MSADFTGMLVGAGARRFALDVGAETCRTLDLLVGRDDLLGPGVLGDADLVEVHGVVSSAELVGGAAGHHPAGADEAEIVEQD